MRLAFCLDDSLDTVVAAKVRQDGGRLDVHRLRAMSPADAMHHLQELPGIGPFFAALVVTRGCGRTDVLPTEEPMTLRLVPILWGLAAPIALEDDRARAEAWRPFRTWTVVLIRAGAGRLLAPEALPSRR